MGLPNMISVFRLILVPVFILVYISGLENAHTYAALIFFVAGISDVLDGIIARKLDLTTDLGKILDPLGDKLMVLAALIMITIDSVIPLWAVIIFTIKELFMGLGGLIAHRRISTVPQSNYLGKASTVYFFVICGVLMLFPEIPGNIAEILIGIAIGLSLLAFFKYLFGFIKLMKESPVKESDI